MRVRPRVTYEKIIIINLKGDILAEKAKNISLQGVLIHNGFLKDVEAGTQIEVTLDLDTENVNLRGKILRKDEKNIFIKFLEDSSVIARTVGMYIKNVASKTKKCPYCNSLLTNDTNKCENCGMFLNFDNPELVDVLNKLDVAQVIEFMLSKNKENCGIKEEVLEMIGSSQKMKEVFRLIRKYATTDFPVLIIGESGTGKELTAKAIHERSLRNDKPYIIVDCTAIPENLLESELFGYEKGAFTGAEKMKVGRVELANGGTLFLDEIGDLPLPLQAKLLRFLETGSFTRIGGIHPIKVDVRIIAATNVDLDKAVKEGKFREDLYYRLNVLAIHLPPLREREDDIEIIAKYFLRKYSKEIGKNIKDFSPAAISALKRYSWPGNVRELLNIIRKAVVMADGEYIEIFDLDKRISSGIGGKEKEIQMTFSLEAEKEKVIKRIYTETGGNISKISKILGISRPTVYKLLAKYNLRNE